MIDRSKDDEARIDASSCEPRQVSRASDHFLRSNNRKRTSVTSGNIFMILIACVLTQDNLDRKNTYLTPGSFKKLGEASSDA